MSATTKLRHVVWDWNGTLLDDAWLSILSINRLLEEQGAHPLTPEQYAAVFGFPLCDYYRKLGFVTEGAPFAELCTRFYALYQAREPECRLQPGAREVLEHLAARNVTQSILSAYQEEGLRRVVEHHGLAGHFDAVIGHVGRDAGSKVENARRWLAGSGLVPGEVLYVGDTLHDAEVAAALGVECRILPSGHQSVARLEAGGAPVLGALDEILELFEGAPE